MNAGIQVRCHRCGYTWTYLGYKVALVGRVRNSIRIQCRRCRTSTVLIRGQKKAR